MHSFYAHSRISYVGANCSVFVDVEMHRASLLKIEMRESLFSYAPNLPYPARQRVNVRKVLSICALHLHAVINIISSSQIRTGVYGSRGRRPFMVAERHDH